MLTRLKTINTQRNWAQLLNAETKQTLWGMDKDYLLKLNYKHCLLLCYSPLTSLNLTICLTSN